MSARLQMWAVKERRSQKMQIVPDTIKSTRQSAIKAFMDGYCSSSVPVRERDLHWRWLRDHVQVRTVKVSIQECF